MKFRSLYPYKQARWERIGGRVCVWSRLRPTTAAAAEMCVYARERKWRCAKDSATVVVVVEFETALEKGQSFLRLGWIPQAAIKLTRALHIPSPPFVLVSGAEERHCGIENYH